MSASLLIPPKSTDERRNPGFARKAVSALYICDTGFALIVTLFDFLEFLLLCCILGQYNGILQEKTLHCEILARKNDNVPLKATRPNLPSAMNDPPWQSVSLLLWFCAVSPVNPGFTIFVFLSGVSTGFLAVFTR